MTGWNVALIASDNFNTKNISWGAWVYPVSSAASRTIIQKNNEFRLTTNGSGFPQCEVYSGSWQTPAVATSVLPLSTWSHVLCTYDGSNIILYVNGLPVGNTAQTGNVTSTSSTALNIGRDSAGSGYFSGQIDDVKVYTYPLTAPLVKQAVNEGAAVRYGPSSGSP